MSKEVIGDQGEVRITKINAIPDGIKTTVVVKSDCGSIVGHSESGQHHVLLDGDVMERTSDVPEGMKILYAIVSADTEFVHNAPNSHGAYKLSPGFYEFRIRREYNPFAEQARQVQD